MSSRLAAIFREAARSDDAAATWGPRVVATRASMLDLLQLHGEDSAAILLLLAAVLSVMPVVGLGSVLGFVILALAWRWHRGADASLLPDRLGSVTLNEAWTRRCLRFLAWMYTTAEQRLTERWTLLCHGRTHGWWGSWIGLMGLLIMMPVPLGNVLPSLSLILLSLGWMFRDGLALLLSALVGAGAIAYAVAMSHLVVDWTLAALAWVQASGF